MIFCKVSFTICQNFLCCSPNNNTKRVDCELNAEGVVSNTKRTISSIFSSGIGD